MNRQRILYLYRKTLRAARILPDPLLRIYVEERAIHRYHKCMLEDKPHRLSLYRQEAEKSVKILEKANNGENAALGYLVKHAYGLAGVLRYHFDVDCPNQSKKRRKGYNMCAQPADMPSLFKKNLLLVLSKLPERQRLAYRCISGYDRTPYMINNPLAANEAILEHGITVLGLQRAEDPPELRFHSYHVPIENEPYRPIIKSNHHMPKWVQKLIRKYVIQGLTFHFIDEAQDSCVRETLLDSL